MIGADAQLGHDDGAFWQCRADTSADVRVTDRLFGACARIRVVELLRFGGFELGNGVAAALGGGTIGSARRQRFVEQRERATRAAGDCEVRG